MTETIRTSCVIGVHTLASKSNVDIDLYRVVGLYRGHDGNTVFRLESGVERESLTVWKKLMERLHEAMQ